MEQIRFRNLTADEIDCRVGQAGKTSAGAWATLLLYKDARVDMTLLDEMFGPYGWQREHKELKNVMYCGVSLRDPGTGEWITKWDAGAESNTEAEKGEASDSFKRACVNWGLGRELYTGPVIFINLKEDEYKADGYNIKVNKNVKFFVKDISISDDKKITVLTIVDRTGTERFTWKTGAKPSTKKAAAQPKAEQPATQQEATKKPSNKGGINPQEEVREFLRENPNAFQFYQSNFYQDVADVDMFNTQQLTEMYVGKNGSFVGLNKNASFSAWLAKRYQS